MRLHEHARERMRERGATEEEVEITIRGGERFPAKLGRCGFRRNFPSDWTWRGRRFTVKQIEVFAVFEDDDWLVISVIVKYF